MKQRTLLREVATKGRSLHTGETVHLTFKPAPAGHGYVFRRIDLYGKPEIPAAIDLVGRQLVRSTDLSAGGAKVHTVEHVLSALRGLEIDNAVIEMDASEPPILDGSAREFVRLLREAGSEEQDAEREVFVLDQPISIQDGNRSLIALPYDGLRITCTSTDDRGTHTQHLCLDIDPETYVREVAAARTFTVYEDIEPLLKMGKIRGGSLDSAIVIKGDKILSKEPLRFPDEFVRHKILDIIGDLVLLGVPLRAHIIAVRTGHALNAQLSRALRERFEVVRAAGVRTVAEAPPPRSSNGSLKVAQPAQGAVALPIEQPAETVLDIRRVLDLLPHRYPFVLVDRVIHIGEDNQSLVAIKNVSINEPYFQGHYPGRPVMPGVLQVEAMAQAAGILLLRIASRQNRVALFMKIDGVKFRQAVTPGDQLVIRVKLTKIRGEKVASAQGVCEVGGKEVSRAELMFALADADEEEGGA